MKIILLLFIPVLLVGSAFGQTKKLVVQNHTFIIKSKKVNNEWDSKDEVRQLYRKDKLLLTYYAYKDEGGDCNNLFWDKEWLEVQKNKIIITTHHFQKTNIDPITEWEKRTFTVLKNGELKLTKHVFKKYGSKDWKEEEEWYKR